MSTITYFERDGERIVIPSGTDLKEETRCDGCGEFVSSPDSVRGRIDAIVFSGGVARPQPPISFDAHLSHLGQAIAAIGQAIGELDA